MSEKLKPNQALFIWKLLTARTAEAREPAKSKAKPDLKKDFKPLIDRGYVTVEKRGRSQHVALTEKAWSWAERMDPIEILKSRSSVGAEVLQDLLSSLVPFLASKGIPLAELVAGNAMEGGPEDAPTFTPSPDALWPTIEAACLFLANGRRKERVLLAALRSRLASVARTALDEALKQLQRQGKLVLYREDNSAALTPADRAAELVVGDQPRHIVYLEN